MAFIKKQLRPKTIKRALNGKHRSVKPVRGGFKKETIGPRGGITERVWNSNGIRQRVTLARLAFLSDSVIQVEKTYDKNGKLVGKRRGKG